MNKRECVESWVDGFNAISYSVIERLMRYNRNDIQEITPLVKGDNVYCSSEDVSGTITKIKGDICYIKTDEDKTFKCSINKCRNSYYNAVLPAWGTLWSFNDSSDVYWLKEEGGLEDMATCGFRIYKDICDNEYYFGIDGAGYSFYEEHWIPLYEKRGLKWHKK